MIHAICDFCGKDCDRKAMLLTLKSFSNFARYHTDTEPFGTVSEAQSFVICSSCRQKHKLPNPYEHYGHITEQELHYPVSLSDDISISDEEDGAE